MGSEKKLVYVAGPIGASTDARERFAAAALDVAQLGYQPVSPLELCGGTTHVNACHTWREHMEMDIRALLTCEGIYLLRGWENSRGARLEKLIADGLGMFILFQPDNENVRHGQLSTNPLDRENYHPATTPLGINRSED